MSSGKQISDSDIIGQAGINLIERRVLEMGYLFRPEPIFDAGIDGQIEIRDPVTKIVTNVRIGVQSKATNGHFSSETDVNFSYIVDERDLDYWLKGNLPIILVRSHPERDEAYWVSIKDYFNDPEKRKTRKIVFYKQTDRFDKNAADKLAQIALGDLPGNYLEQPPRKETLVSNLLKLESYPDTIYLASSRFRERQAVRNIIEPFKLGSEWFLRSGMIYSFYDLREEPWKQVCDVGSVEALPSHVWSESTDRVQLNEFIELLTRSLDEKLWQDGVDYYSDLEIHYFMLEDNTTRKEGTGRSSRGRTVIQHYKEDGKFDYYRHYALKSKFHRFSNQWYLELTPTYYFTSNGFAYYAFHEQLLKKIKTFEGNDAVRYLVEFWAGYLGKQPGLFRQDASFIQFDRLEDFNILFGFDDKLWKHVEGKDLPKAFTDAPLFEVEQ